MIANSDWIQVDPAQMDYFLSKDALDEWSGDGQLVLDFSCVPRIDVRALERLDELARRASEKFVKIACPTKARPGQYSSRHAPLARRS